MLVIKTKDIKVFLKHKFILIVKTNLTDIEAPEIKGGGPPSPMARATYVSMRAASHSQPHVTSARARNLLNAWSTKSRAGRSSCTAGSRPSKQTIGFYSS